MIITLFSGLPGAGKTAQLVAELVRFREREPDTPRFAYGINGLDPSVATVLTLEELRNWKSLPAGSVVAVDECQKVGLMPKDNGKPEAWVRDLAEVRHFGIRFWLTTQDPKNVSTFVRGLIGCHVLFVRKFRTIVVQSYTWGRCIEDPYVRREQADATVAVATLPKSVFSLYKSSELHTVKAKIPLRFYAIPVLAIAIAACCFLVPHMIHKSTVAKSSPAPATASSVSVADAALRQKDYEKWSKPRVPGLPWTAPMFDKLEVKAQPRLYCIADEDGGCRCETEQGTSYDVPLKTCRSMVANGVYNPFAAPPAEADHQSQEGDARTADREQAPPDRGQRGDVAVSSDIPSSGGWKDSPVHAAYTPPELMPKEGPVSSGTGM
ncbi:hypothetical protein EKH79_03120 [Dyella dinghuensis]|uniref:Zona occludens toxin N-terminal domain-containing protein n=1 Tax=Dyella dinghuensis TaxID=1920169 RepID=A0A3S0PEH7_9GAMM|nr:zonular occludens toxin domain-containing protein [Dyella dinghuensis]RUL66816.1 hypothetical protein EKH79_03120 [Dyella dinghuensis]